MKSSLILAPTQAAVPHPTTQLGHRTGGEREGKSKVGDAVANEAVYKYTHIHTHIGWKGYL